MTTAQATSTGGELRLPAWPLCTAMAVAAVWANVAAAGIDAWPVLFPATLVIALILVGADARYASKLRLRLARLRATAAGRADRDALQDTAIIAYEIGLQVKWLQGRLVVMAGLVLSLFGLQLLSGFNPVAMGLVGGLVVASVVVARRLHDAALDADAAYVEIMARTCDDPPPPRRLFTLVMLGAIALPVLAIVLLMPAVR